MKRTGLPLILGVVAGLAVLSVGAVAPVPQGSSEVEQLKKEVAALRQRVASLEERLKDGSVLIIPKDGRNRPDIINPYPGPHREPPYWQKFEFNGIPCYIIPVNQAGTPASETKSQVPPDKIPPAPTDSAPKP